MKNFLILSLSFLIVACQQLPSPSLLIVKDKAALQEAIESAKPGTNITLANGIWKDINIRFTGNGTVDKPIIIKAETAGKVFLEGQSDLKFGGTYLEVHDLYFKF